MLSSVIEKDLEQLEKEFEEFKKDVEERRFLITGGAGFIGSWISDLLYRLGAEIYILDNFSTGKMENIDHLIESNRVKLLNYDVSKEEWKEDEIIKDTNFDFVLHLAARADPQNYIKYPIDTMLSNSFGTLYTLQIAERDNAIYYFSSTSEVYGEPQVHPQPETYWGNVNPIGERSCYDEAKRFSEALVLSFFREKDLNVKMNRIFNTYGPRLDDGRVISTFIRQSITGKPITVFGDGTQTRSPCYITDMVRGIILTIFKGKSGEVYNVGAPEEYQILELAKIIKKLTGTESEIVFKERMEDDPSKRRPDINKIKNELGFEPKVSLEEGLKKTIEWFKEVYM